MQVFPLQGSKSVVWQSTTTHLGRTKYLLLNKYGNYWTRPFKGVVQ